MPIEWRVLPILDTLHHPSGSQILNRRPTPTEAHPQSSLTHDLRAYDLGYLRSLRYSGVQPSP